MATLVIKNLPDNLHARLEAQPRRHHLSVKEIVHLLEAGVGGDGERPLPSVPIRLRSGCRPSVEDIEDVTGEGQD